MLAGIFTGLGLASLFAFLFLSFHYKRYAVFFKGTTEEMSERDKRNIKASKNKFALELAGRYVFGLIYSFLILYAGNMSRNDIDLFEAYFFFVALLLIWDCFVVFGSTEFKNIPNLLYGVIAIVLLLGGGYYNLIYAHSYYEELHGLVKAEIIDGLPTESTDRTNIQLMNRSSAEEKGDDYMSQVPNPRAYDQGEYSLTNVGGEARYLAPVKFSSYKRSMSAKVIPGFLNVSATDPLDAGYTGDYRMKFTPDHYYNQNLERLIRKNHPETLILENYLDIDTEGELGKKNVAYYVTSFGHYYKNDNWVVVDGVYLTNTETGEIVEYKVGKEPKFVDRVYPMDVAIQNFKFQLEFHDGFWNAFWAQKDTYVPNGDKLVETFDEEGNLQYVGEFVRGKGKGGVVLYGILSAKTGKMEIYDVAGVFSKDKKKNVLSYITSGKAVKIANQFDSIVEKKGAYKGKFGTFHNIYNEATYIVPIFDKNNKYVMMCVVRANSENNVVVCGKSKEETFNKYKTALADALRKKGDFVPSEDFQLQTIEGVVDTIENVVIDGNSIYYIGLTNNKKIYTVKPASHPFITRTKVGETVVLKVFETEEDIISVETFEHPLYKK